MKRVVIAVLSLAVLAVACGGDKAPTLADTTSDRAVATRAPTELGRLGLLLSATFGAGQDLKDARGDARLAAYLLHAGEIPGSYREFVPATTGSIDRTTPGVRALDYAHSVVFNMQDMDGSVPWTFALGSILFRFNDLEDAGSLLPEDLDEALADISEIVETLQDDGWQVSEIHWLNQNDLPNAADWGLSVTTTSPLIDDEPDMSEAAKDVVFRTTWDLIVVAEGNLIGAVWRQSYGSEPAADLDVHRIVELFAARLREVPNKN